MNIQEIIGAALVAGACLGYRWLWQREKAKTAEKSEALQAIWPFIECDFPKGTGEDHGTCATEGYRKAADMVRAIIEVQK